MLGGNGPLKSRDRLEIDRALRAAETYCRLEFSVFVGSVEDHEPRAFAERLHASLLTPEMSVLLMVDPDERALEIVTGADARRRLDDRSVGLAATTMQRSFERDDLVGGLRDGLRCLSEHARRG